MNPWVFALTLSKVSSSDLMGNVYIDTFDKILSFQTFKKVYEQVSGTHVFKSWMSHKYWIVKSGKGKLFSAFSRKTQDKALV